jgi:hypothetical protein
MQPQPHGQIGRRFRLCFCRRRGSSWSTRSSKHSLQVAGTRREHTSGWQTLPSNGGHLCQTPWHVNPTPGGAIQAPLRCNALIPRSVYTGMLCTLVRVPVQLVAMVGRPRSTAATVICSACRVFALSLRESTKIAHFSPAGQTERLVWRGVCGGLQDGDYGCGAYHVEGLELSGRASSFGPWPTSGNMYLCICAAGLHRHKHEAQSPCPPVLCSGPGCGIVLYSLTHQGPCPSPCLAAGADDVLFTSRSLSYGPSLRAG